LTGMTLEKRGGHVPQRAHAFASVSASRSVLRARLYPLEHGLIRAHLAPHAEPPGRRGRHLMSADDHSSAQIKLNFWNQVIKPNIH
jgi:hypothetical protein